MLLTEKEPQKPRLRCQNLKRSPFECLYTFGRNGKGGETKKISNPDRSKGSGGDRSLEAPLGIDESKGAHKAENEGVAEAAQQAAALDDGLTSEHLELLSSLVSSI